MKHNKKVTRLIIAVNVLVFFFAFSQKDVQCKWWNKGLNVLKTMDTGTEKSDSGQPGTNEIIKAFKEALSIGSENVVKRLGKVNGFNNDSAIHIPLPEELNTVKTMLAKFGMSQMTDDLELKLNRAAEAATPKAEKLFLGAIRKMSFKDIKNIYNGPDDAATKYFRKIMTPELSREMKPIIQNSLAEVGAVKSYDRIMGKYKTLPFVPDIKANLTDYVVQKGMDGIFHYIAKEESAIRKDPAKQTTALLRKVFSAK